MVSIIPMFTIFHGGRHQQARQTRWTRILGTVMAESAYVIIGLRKERCRAKDPSKCRYHTSSDGKTLHHYTSAWAADKALRKLIREHESEPPRPKTIAPPEGSECTDYKSIAIQDGTMNGDNGDAGPSDDGDRYTDEPTGTTESEDLDSTGIDEESLFTPNRRSNARKAQDNLYAHGHDITSGTIQQLNMMRFDASLCTAASMAASNLIREAGEALLEHGVWKNELAWKYGEDGARTWAEWPDTRHNDIMNRIDPNKAVGLAPVNQENTNTEQVVYTDSIRGHVQWSHDFIDGNGNLGTELLSYEAGFYDAVMTRSVTWDDLKMVNAVTCWLNATIVEGRRGDTAITRTVNVWCGRKPKPSLYVQGDTDDTCGKGVRDLVKMVRMFREMTIGCTDATVTLTLIGDSK